MYLIHSKTKKRLTAKIEKVRLIDFKKIEKSIRFSFDWNTELNNTVYSIRLENSPRILGLISIVDLGDSIKINLIESSKENIGSSKKYERIAGCLLSFACKISFEKNYDGTVSLESKSKIKKHYIEKYNFLDCGSFLYTDGVNSENLIKDYLY
ncbi:MAG: hypothetical protein JSS63_15235 [Bacteroidetes bacterium]|nr:hypothetical protein [Bacteroidota bacterium]